MSKKKCLALCLFQGCKYYNLQGSSVLFFCFFVLFWCSSERYTQVDTQHLLLILPPENTMDQTERPISPNVFSFAPVGEYRNQSKVGPTLNEFRSPIQHTSLVHGEVCAPQKETQQQKLRLRDSPLQHCEW